MNRSTAGACMCLALGTASAVAQSTSRVGHRERDLQWELSGGSGNASGTYVYEDDDHIRVAALGLRLASQGSGGVRLSLWSTEANGKLAYTTFQSGVQRTDTTRRTERMIALVATADYTVRIAWDLLGSISVGGGVVPYAHGSQSGSGPGIYASESTSGSASIWVASAALRYRWLFVEQHVAALNGADRPIRRARDFTPILFGIRII